MKLYTSVDIAPSEKKIGYSDKVLLLGSCFADNIGSKFEEHYFQTTVNPFGTLYNPASIAEAISMSAVSCQMSDFVSHNGLWHSMMHHGSFSHPDKDELIRRSAAANCMMSNALKEANIIIITFGTAWVYEMDGRVVANCHKLPADRFVRRRLTAEEIVAMWHPIITSMPDKHWIFTVSPIRHVKDGLHENQLSKAILLQAVDELAGTCACGTYFPSYEIMLDELRDYRFYAEDMVHPSPMAVGYMWERFVGTFMTESTRTEMRDLHQLWRDRQHRFLHPESEEAERFRQHLEKRIAELKKKYPWLQ